MDIRDRIRNLSEDQLRKLQARLAATRGGPPASAQRPASIAIVGLSFRLPGGANDLESLWRLLAAGRDAIRREPLPRHPGGAAGPRTAEYWGGYIDDIDAFDAAHFRLSPREAALIDPQHRMFLEATWHALEDAGYRPGQLAGSRTGVYAGICNHDYSELLQLHAGVASTAYCALGTSPSLLANRVSFAFDLRGPSETIDTACSSSLVALHHGVRALRHGECDQAIVGGVNLLLSPRLFTAFLEAGMLSPDGRCRTFDARANGYVRGEGVVCLVLKPLARAEADGDAIHGVIRGTAVNHGGKASSLTAPNPAAQADLIVAAYHDAGVPIDSIGYIEAHGTGTVLGDPLEVEALRDAFARLGARRSAEPCALGSVKSNLGHLESAAGLSGVVKLVACLARRQLPPVAGLTQLNPHLDIAGTPFRVLDALEPWRPRLDEHGAAWPLRAGVSSFGFGGANAHAVLEAYEPRARAIAAPSRPRAFVLSARTAPQLTELAVRLRDHLAGATRLAAEQLESIACTLQLGREAMAERAAFIAEHRDDVLAAVQAFLRGQLGGNVLTGRAARGEPGALDAPAPGDGIDDVRALARSWVAGRAVDWAALYRTDRPDRAHLPVYAFARERHWAGELIAPAAADAEHGLVYAAPVWEPAAPPAATAVPAGPAPLLVLASASAALAHKLATAHPAAELLALSSLDAAPAEARFTADFLALFEQVRAQLRDGRAARPVLVIVRAEPEVPGQPDRSVFAYAPLLSLIKTACLENPRVRGKLVTVPASWSDEQVAAAVGRELAHDAVVDEVRYRDGGEREIRRWREISPPAPAARDARAADRDGAYWMTGGLGGLGAIFARHLAGAGGPAIVLTSRGEPGAADRAWLEALRASGAIVEHIRGDVAVREDVERVVHAIRATHGRIRGVIHAAGALRDGFLVHKTEGDARAVLAPKVAGVVHVDHATRAEPLELFVVFSSIAAVLGSVGQADYAAANAFLDGYAEYRSALVQAGARAGTTVAVNWPLWRDGGMRVDARRETELRETLGVVPLDSAVGLAVFDALRAGPPRQLLVLAGRVDQLRARALGAGVFRAAGAERAPAQPTDGAGPPSRAELLARLKDLFAATTRLPADRLDETEPFEMYGIDSIMVAHMNCAFDEVLGDDLVSKTLLYEHRTLGELADYFLREHPAHVGRWLTGAREASAPPVAQPVAPAPRVRAGRGESQVAVIGIAGHYPGADDLAQFWHNLERGRCCIDVVPRERWNVDEHYCADRDEAVRTGKSYSKWGGFVSGFADFDCLLFNVSPREAINIDPQERKFLECCWELLEDAGYTRAALRDRVVGVYAGITKTGFDLYRSPELEARGVSPQTSFGSLANRVSHVFDFHGPSLPVDTMCSASLTALHLAYEHIRSGECEVAIAGGVNLYLHPSSYVFLSRMRMLSGDGRNRSFGAGAAGFVPGEGVGAVMLKALDRAEADRDRIYAVVRASAINHGGKTSGYTVPNPNAQRDLIARALDRAGISARTISYIEAHGTGTDLGDPIEIAGLSHAFQRHTDDKQFCAIGSVKSNIGHLEAAAGIAGVTKVVLQLAHQMLVPSLDADELNPNINFALSPFQVQRELAPWPRPIVDGVECPRRAGVSSFGAGGANAHVILEEYTAAASQPAQPELPGETALVVCSARTAESLDGYLEKLAAFLRRGDVPPLADLAFTLRVGREAMECRVAFIVGSIPELRAKIDAYLAGDPAIARCYRSGAQRAPVPDGGDDLDRLAASWCAGGSLDAARLDRGPLRRIALPTYAFARRKLWFSSPGEPTPPREVIERGEAAEPAPRPAPERRDVRTLARVRLSRIDDIADGTGPAEVARPHARIRLDDTPAAAPPPAGPPAIAPPARTARPSPERESAVGSVLRRTLAKLLFLSDGEIGDRDRFIDLGLDSILAVEWTRLINEQLGIRLTTARLYDHPTVSELSRAVADLAAIPPVGESGDPPREPASVAPAPAAPLPPSAAPLPPSVASAAAAAPPSAPGIEIIGAAPLAGRRRAATGKVAIIGSSGRFPGARDLDELWRNLASGVRSIVEVPCERWDAARRFDPSGRAPGSIYAKWLGALDGVDEFDPGFFQLSPVEAECMDPQQRLFLQEGWKALEDAGYARDALDRKRCGTYLGIMANDYWHVVSRNREYLGMAHTMLGNSNAISAARLAFLLNLRGPAIAVDTACSSSLVAAHLACQALLVGEIDMALVGGATVYLSEDGYRQMCDAGMLSRHGMCASFDQRADGIVPGEAVTAIVLKRLEDAEADRDHIHGVIIGSGINQDGRTNGITAPSAQAQVELQRRVYEEHGISPATIGYIETHGTGTKLGDPIEFDALSTVFREPMAGKRCPIGSVKSNLGHTAAAAGLVSLQKVLLALHHAQLPPSASFERGNEHIDFADSPLYVNDRLVDWPRSGDAPRRAAISSFGFSGTNAHMVVEEYVARPEARAAPGVRMVVPLSARTAEALPVMAQRLRAALEARSGSDAVELADVAYTLQVGREPLEHRVAFLARDVVELCAQLDAFCAAPDRPGLEGVIRGRVSRERDEIRQLYLDEDLRDGLARWSRKGKVEQLARVWVNGLDLEWASTSEGRAPRRISLPTYPFARGRYWVPLAGDSRPAAQLHPLVHANTSVLGTQRFTSVLTGDEPVLRDHRLAGERLLPAVAYLEMVRAAAALAGVEGAIGLRHVLWAEPLVVGAGGRRVDVTLAREGGELRYEVTSREDQRTIVHGQGIIEPRGAPRGRAAARAAARGQGRIVTGDALYAYLAARGLDYGPAFRCVEAVEVRGDEAIARLASADPPADYVIDPGIADAALQVVAAFGIAGGMAVDRTYLPLSARAIEIHRPTPARAEVVARRIDRSADGELQTFDVEIADAQGQLCVVLSSFAIRATPATRPEAPRAAARPSPAPVIAPPPVRPGLGLPPGTICATVEWRARPIESAAADAPRPATLLWCGIEPDATLAHGPHHHVLPRPAAGVGPHEVFARAHDIVRRALASGHDQRILAITPVGGEHPLYACLAGLLKTARLESSRLETKRVAVDGLTELAPARLLEIVARELREPGFTPEVRYRHDGTREVPCLVELEPRFASDDAPAARSGAYWITGGLGGLGVVLARHLASRGQTRVVLSGRSAPSGDRQRALDALRGDGLAIEYLRADVSDLGQVREAAAEIRRRHGRIAGIVHGAGVLRDALIASADASSAAEVFAPKVSGALHLDEATRDDDLDVFVLLGSIAGVFGNVGQAGYSAANAFLDAFAHWREELRRRGERRGAAIAIDWPLWRDGGMRIDPRAERRLDEQKGLHALSTEHGLAVFELAIAQRRHTQLIVLSGDEARLRAGFAIEAAAPATPPPAPAAAATAAHRPVLDELQVRADIVGELSRLLKIAREDIDPDSELSDLGVDSILTMKMLSRLEERYGEAIEPSAVLDHPSVAALAQFLVAEGLARGASAAPPAVADAAPAPVVRPPDMVPDRSSGPPVVRVAGGARRVAIIGMSCRLPRSDTPEALWSNLADARDLIGEAPRDRWEPEAVFSADRSERNKAYATRAGFVDDIASFDAAFFGISHDEALALDPQQRIVLELAQELFDRAGYGRDGIAGSNTGVILGAKENNYVRNNYHRLPAPALKHAIVNTIGNMIAARVSDFYNLKGTSKTIDTACSSSLVAVHDACQAIVSGETDMAVAGGVFLLVDPFAHIGFSRAEVLSDDGRSYVFDERAKGFVLGEGAGLILLKDLDAAVRDGDEVLAVILGSAVNNDGKTMGVTVPNQEAQKAVIEAALHKSQVNPEDITCYEAHGTGTLLGDPIEIRAATQVYRKYTSKLQYCALGSIKSNLGHTMTAAGVSSLLKVILSLQRRQIPATLHCQRPHPRFKFPESPFFPNTRLVDWVPPRGRRIAAISSLGFGGTNCHMVVGEPA